MALRACRACRPARVPGTSGVRKNTFRLKGLLGLLPFDGPVEPLAERAVQMVCYAGWDGRLEFFQLLDERQGGAGIGGGHALFESVAN